MLSGLKFHHAGVACHNIEFEIRFFAALGYAMEGEMFEDSLQGIRGVFMTMGGHRIELVAPLDDKSRILNNVLSARLKVYHFGYLTSDIGRSLAEATQARARVMVEPVAAIAFGGQRIAFVFMPNMLLVEFIEAMPELPL